MTTPLNEQRHIEHLFLSKPSGRVAASSVAARTALELFASSIRSTLGGSFIDISVSAHRDDGHLRWQFHVHGVEGSVSVAFLETGRTHLPTLNLEGSSTGELADSVDVHYLFEFLKRELLTESTVF
jgi:hypothetical protein